MFPLLLIGPSKKNAANETAVYVKDSDGGRSLTKLVKLGLHLRHHWWLIIIAEDRYSNI